LLALDFLNPKKPIPRGESWRRRARGIGIAVGAAASLVAVGYGRMYWQLRTERSGLVSANNKLRSEVEAKREIQDQIDRAKDWAIEAVWPDDLLNLTEATVEPGKKMLVQGVDMETGTRTQKITLRNVHAADWQVPMDFVRTLNEIRREDEQIYEAKPLAWSEIHNNEKFKGKLDIEIELRRLAARQAEAQQHEKQRKAPKKAK
jgi:hypothetical protein